MNRIYILCVEDEPDVLEALIRDLRDLEQAIPIEAASSATEAREVIAQVEKAGDRLAVIFCDHIMTGENGVDLLIGLEKEAFTHLTRKVLVTAHAGLEETIEAVNRAGLAHYIGKPWKREELLQVARTQLTQYLIAAQIDPSPYLRFLDPMLLGEAVRKGFMSDA